MFDALVHGQDRNIARAAQAAVRENPLEASQRADVAVGIGPDAVHGVGPRQVQRFFVDGAAYMGEVVAGLLSENFNSLAHSYLILVIIPYAIPGPIGSRSMAKSYKKNRKIIPTRTMFDPERTNSGINR